MKRFYLGALGAFFIAIMSFTVAERALAYDQIFIFGDSISDVGNVFVATGGLEPAPPPDVTPTPKAYFDGRFSNGPVWSDRLAAFYGLTLTRFLENPVANPNVTGQSINYAFGGSQSGFQNQTPDGLFTVPGANGQISAFTDALAGTGANPDALYVVWTGANDYLIAPPNNLPPATSTANVVLAITRLHALGARHFLIPSLPDLGTTPFAQLLNIAGDLTAATNAYNGLLSAELATLRNTLADISIIQLDANFLFAAILDKPDFFGFDDPATQPLFGAGPASGCLFTIFIPTCNLAEPDPAPGVFWYDEEHPSEAVYKIVGAGAVIALACVREDFASKARYVHCVINAARDARDQGLLTLKQKLWFIWQAVMS